MMKNVGVFVDLNNQFSSVKETFQRKKVDYGRYLKAAVGGESLYRAFAYGVQYGDEAREFIATLRERGFETRYRQVRNSKQRQSVNWNLGIGIDVIRILDRLDIVIFGSNDPELIPLVQFCQERGKRVVIFSCRISDELRQVADGCVEIDQDLLDRRKKESV